MGRRRKGQGRHFLVYPPIKLKVFQAGRKHKSHSLKWLLYFVAKTPEPETRVQIY